MGLSTKMERLVVMLNSAGWLPSLLPRFRAFPGVKVAPLAQFSPSSEPSAPAVSSQERTSTSVGPPGEGGRRHLRDGGATPVY